MEGRGPFFTCEGEVDENEAGVDNDEEDDDDVGDAAVEENG